jgi:hypothetical protein
MSIAISGREPHPTIPLPEPKLSEFMGKDWCERFYAVRREGIARMENDPLRYGYEPPSWKRADDAIAAFRKKHPVGVIIALILGGHRASKTEWRAKRTVQNLFGNPNYKVWACQATQEASREAQQSKIYKYLPPEYKSDTGKMRYGSKLKVNYAPWSGFTEDVFAVQDSKGGTSECRFKFYSMNARSLEGAEIDEGWADEEASLEWLDAMIFRLVSRNGILPFTFTPRWGYTQTVKAVLNGAVTLEETEADVDLLAVRDAGGKAVRAKKVPLIQENPNVQILGNKVKAIIVYFHTAENPFPYSVAAVEGEGQSAKIITNWDSMKATLKGASDEKILTVAYGVPTKAMMARFPLFSDTAHVISLNRFREIQKGGGTWFHFLDPCSGRNWFQQWVFVDPLNRAFVAGESPSYDHDWAYIPGVGNPGPWAVAGNKADGEQGDGQKEWGWGYARYLEEIERMERLLALPISEGKSGKSKAHRIEISARWIDARYGNARRTAEERSTTLIEDLSALGMDFLAAPSEKAIDSGRGGGDGSLRMINDKLYYDVQKPIDHTNQPKLYVVETCPNTMYALREWTGKDGQHGASKDPVDCLRMFVLSGSEFVDEALLQPRTPWMAQFGK